MFGVYSVTTRMVLGRRGSYPRRWTGRRAGGRALRYFLALMLFAPTLAAQAPPVASTLTLTEAVRVSLEKNPTLAAADAILRRFRRALRKRKPRVCRAWTFPKAPCAAKIPCTFSEVC